MKRFAALVLSLLMLLAGCNRGQMENESSSAPASESSRVAAVTVPLENPPELFPMPEELPQMYQEDGKYGFLAPDGSVLVPAEYQMAYEFGPRSLGSVRRDEGEDITWYTVGLDGTLLGNVNDTVVSAGELGSLVCIEDHNSRRWQLMNLNLQPVLPDWAEGCHFFAGSSDPGRFFLTWEGKGAVEFLPDEMALLEFEPYDESRKDQYREIWDLAQQDVVVVNGRELIGPDGHMWDDKDLPLAALEQTGYTLWNSEDGSTRPARLQLSHDPYYGTYMWEADGQGTPEEQVYGETNWMALPGTVADWPKAEPVEDAASLLELTKDYRSAESLKDAKVEEALRGRFSEDGNSGVLLALSSGADIPLGESDENSRAHSAVLWYPDEKDPHRYQIVMQGEITGGKACMMANYRLVGFFPGREGTVRVMVAIQGYEGPRSYQWSELEMQ